MTEQYTEFSTIYDIWTSTSPYALSSVHFYKEKYLQDKGPTVELGIGNGRIALEAVLKGKSIIGIDISQAMLDLCQQKAAQLNVENNIHLIKDDFRHFSLKDPASLISLPYHSIGHLQTPEDKKSALENIYNNLSDGGVFIFDDFIYNPDLAEKFQKVELRTEYVSEQTGNTVFLWVTSKIDPDKQQIKVLTWTDEVDENHILIERKYRKLDLTWMTPQQWQELFDVIGFKVKNCWGNFDKENFDPFSSKEQIWEVQK